MGTGLAAQPIVAVTGRTYRCELSREVIARKRNRKEKKKTEDGGMKGKSR